MSCVISGIVGYRGKIIWDRTKPNGTMRKKLDNTIIDCLGWEQKISLIEGLNSVCENYFNKIKNEKQKR